jgi:ATP-dependent phosphofructokinase / diphosphate-dependent phosphofructokinase
MRIGMLTGGGDCPGLNAVIRAVVRNGIDAFGDELVRFRDGWRGVLEGSYVELDIEATGGILSRGGTTDPVRALAPMPSADAFRRFESCPTP